MGLKIQKYALGTFSIRKDVEAALLDLKDYGFPIDKVKIFANGWINRAVGEEEGINRVLTIRGIPQERAKFYQSRLLQGKFLIMLENVEKEIDRIEAILQRSGIQEWGVFSSRKKYINKLKNN